ncbi:mucin-2 [Drosophila ananassae]|nr:mucin-2 [Drosophila ananassae]
MSRRQSLDRPGILSPPGPFLTPSPSPSISASPRLQPSPSLSPFPQDVVLVAGGSQVNANSNPQEHERKAATPGRRQSIHQFTNGSPNAGTVVFQPSPSQSPAAATTVIGVTSGGLIATAGGGSGVSTGVGAGNSSGIGVGVALHSNAIGNELNATLVGSNNIQLNKKGTKRATQQQQQQQQQLGHQIFSSNAVAPTSISSATAVAGGGGAGGVGVGGYGQLNATAISTPTSFATAGSVVSSITGSKGPAKGQKGQQQQFQHYQSSSPLIADSPIPSPSGAITAAAIKPPTPQPQQVQMLPQQFTISQQQQQPAQQVFQFIQGPQGQLIATTPQQQQQPLQQQQAPQPQQQQQQQTQRFVSNAGITGLATGKTGKAPQQILPKPQQEIQQQQKKVGAGGATQISQQQTASNPTQQQQQILLPATTTQPQQLLLNQMPVLVQQNPQGVQLILRPPTPQLTATPSLVIQQNPRGQPQLQTQPAQQQLLRIVGTNGTTMQLAAAPTFIVSSQANLIQQTAASAGQFQNAIKTGTQLTGLHAALAQAQAQAQAPRSQPFATTATLNTQLLGQLQLAAAAQIQMPNGLTTISQLPAHLQQSLGGATINLNQLNGAHIQQIATAFQAPQAPAASGGATSSTELFTQSSPAHVPLAVTPEPLRQPTPVPVLQQQQQQQAAMATIQLQQQQQQQQQAQIQQLQHQLQQTQSQVQQAQQQQSVQAAAAVEPKKKPRPRKKKQVPTVASTPQSTASSVEVTPPKIAIAAAPAPQAVRAKSPSPPPTTIQRSSNGKLDLGDVMKFCGITGDDDDDEDYSIGLETAAEPAEPTQSQSQPQASSSDIMISIPNQNGSDGLPFTLTIPAPQPLQQTTSTSDTATEIPNILIKIDPSADAAVPPFGLSTPRLPTAEEIQKQAQQHLAQQAAAAAAAAKASTATPTISISLPSMSLQPQVVPAPIVTPTPPAATAASVAASATAAVKPRRKPAVRRNTKKPDAPNSSSNTLISASSSNSSTTPTIISSSSLPTTVNTITLTTQSPATSSSNSTLMLSHGTATAVPSQIGNIQISQVQNHNQSTLPVSSTVENKIQIMPILPPGATVMGGTPGGAAAGQAPTSQPTQLVFQSTAPTINTESTAIKLSTDGRQMQLVTIPQATPPQTPAATPASATQSSGVTTTPTLTAGGATILPPQLTGMPANVSVSVGSPASAAALVPQLTGSLTLTVSEQCERLILRHDPNNPQDHQSQLILQALLKGALPNVTIINEPTRVDPSKQSTTILQPQQQVIQIPQAQPQGQLQQQTLSKVSSAPKIEVKVTNNRKLATQGTHPNSSLLGGTGTTTTTTTMKPPASLPAKQNEVLSFPTLPLNSQVVIQQQPLASGQVQSQLQPVTVPVTLPAQPATISLPVPVPTPAPAPAPQLANNGQQRYIALPPIDPSTQQLFCLNSVTNQITAMSAGQTAASIGPTERLLIAPAGINAQQLAQCLQLGQLHFNDVNPLPAQQQQQQQVATSSSLTLSLPLRPQPPQQQIVHPIQPISNGLAVTTTASSTLTTTTGATTTTTTTVTKQVANVAPIIDQSKAKLEPAKAATSGAAGGGGAATGAVVKKKPVRKPKATPTNASELASLKNASVVKPMPKLDPLSQKPNNNPVQIVQPNVASGKQMIVVGSSSCSQTTTTTTTTMSTTIQPFQTTSGTKLVGVTAPMQQQQPTVILQQQQQQPRTSFTVTTATPTPSPTAAPVVSGLQLQQAGQPLQQQQLQVQQQQLPTPKQQQPQPNTVSRVQTIQLTPQMQQVFKQVQMQIQFLTIKLQNKSSFLPVSPEIDATTIAAYIKPMTDVEIHLALQRLFAEQHRILASGKEVPTPEGMLPTANGNGFTLMPQPVQQQQLQATLQVAEPLKTTVPANVVQPNNHSSTTPAAGAASAPGAAAATQRIHIYPMQHQQQQQQQAGNKQPKPVQQKVQQEQPPQPSQLQIKPKEPANRNKANNPQQPLNQQPQQQQQNQNGTINMLPQKSSMLPVPQQQQQPQQQPGGLNKSGPPPLIFASSTNLLTNNNNGSSASSTIHNSNSVMQVNNMLSMPPLQPQQQLQQQQQQQPQPPPPTPILPPVAPSLGVGVGLTPGAIGLPSLPTIPSLPLYMPGKLDDIPTQKPKIARLSLFVRQLEVDQESCLKPDYVKPFRTKDEAVKRLIRYHCMHENDVELHSDEDEEFEATALEFQDKFRQLNGKFQEILMQESTLPHRTSELLQMQQLMIDDLKGEINDFRTAEKELEQQLKLEQNSDAPATQESDSQSEAKVKEEIKEEPEGVVDRFDLLKNSADVNKAFSKQAPQDHSSAVKQEEKGEGGEPAVNGSVDGDGQEKESSKFIKKDFDNFDIESELTTSFIMKKVEHKSEAPKNVENCYQERTVMEPQQPQHQSQQHIKGNNMEQVDQEDGWYCLQKELNLMNNEPMQQQPQQPQMNGNQHHMAINRQQQQQQQSHYMDNSSTGSMMNNSNHIADLFPNGCIDKSNQSTSSSNSSCTSDNHGVKNNSSCSGQREQPVVMDAEQQNQHPAISEFFSSDSDVQKSVENRLEAMFGESPVHLDVKNSSDAHDIESNLDEIFGDSKSPAANHKTKMNMWVPDASFMQQQAAPQHQQQTQYSGSQQQQHHIELNCDNNPRWMQSMEAHYSDFMTSGTSNGELVNGDSRKRSWMGSGSDLEDDNSSKRLCTASSSSSSSPMSSQQQQQQQHVQVPLLDADMLPTGFPQMLMEQQQHQQQQQHNFAYGNMMDQQQQQHPQQQHYQHNMQHQMQHQQQQQMQVSHMGGAAGGEYDDDISRHVASAIDSILNLQNSGDSLQFSLGSILGDSILEDQRQPGNLASCQQEQMVNQRRRQMGDEMNDCLISGGGSGAGSSSLLLEHHHQQQQQQQQHQMMQGHQQQAQHMQHHHHHQNMQTMSQSQAQHLGQLNDFSCGLDDPVKSIMTS